MVYSDLYSITTELIRQIGAPASVATSRAKAQMYADKENSLPNPVFIRS
jgi:hypothetical protein